MAAAGRAAAAGDGAPAGVGGGPVPPARPRRIAGSACKEFRTIQDFPKDLAIPRALPLPQTPMLEVTEMRPILFALAVLVCSTTRADAQSSTCHPFSPT